MEHEKIHILKVIVCKLCKLFTMRKQIILNLEALYNCVIVGWLLITT
jgi:hypothetical protein